MRKPLAGLLAVIALVAGTVLACGGSSSTGTSGTPDPQPSGSQTPGNGQCPAECFRSVTCKKADCTGTPVVAGCCPCPAGYIDELMCADSAPPTTPPKSDCTPACASTEICVRPNACPITEHCVLASAVTCGDASAANCSTTDCTGDLHGSTLDCLCR